MANIIYCRSCGKKLLTYEAHERKYGSPIRSCKKCGKEYLDPRYQELAITETPEIKFRLSSLIITLIIGALLTWRGIYLYGMRQLNTPQELQWLLPTIILIFGILFIVGGIGDTILILTGSKQRKYEKLREESHRRLLNADYANRLSELGYPVPDMYMKGDYNHEKE